MPSKTSRGRKLCGVPLPGCAGRTTVVAALWHRLSSLYSPIPLESLYRRHRGNQESNSLTGCSAVGNRDEHRGPGRVGAMMRRRVGRTRGSVPRRTSSRRSRGSLHPDFPGHAAKCGAGSVLNHRTHRAPQMKAFGLGPSTPAVPLWPSAISVVEGFPPAGVS